MNDLEKTGSDRISSTRGRLVHIARLLAVSLVAVGVIALVTACSDGESPFYEVTWTAVAPDDPGSAPRSFTVTGSDPGCRLNSSYPPSDARRGKFFLSVFDSSISGYVVSVTIHFMDFRSEPPPGTYTTGLDVSGSITTSSGDRTSLSGDFTAVVTEGAGGPLIVVTDAAGSFAGDFQCESL